MLTLKQISALSQQASYNLQIGKVYMIEKVTIVA